MKDITKLRQQARGKAFNAIKKLYHPMSEYSPKYHWQQDRDELVKTIMDEYFKEMERIHNSKKQL